MELIVTTKEELTSIINAAVACAVSDNVPKPKEPFSEFPEMLDRTKAARMLDITLTTLDTWTRKGYVTKHRMGDARAVRFRKSELLADLAKIGKHTQS